jgi:hypothetical protein
MHVGFRGGERERLEGERAVVLEAEEADEASVWRGGG